MKSKIFALLVTIVFACTSRSMGGVESYFRIDGINGDSFRQVWTTHTTVIGYSHEVSQPRDGTAIAKRQHAPFKILKRVSSNSPEYMDKMIQNKAIAKAELKLLGTDINGEEHVRYQYSFTNVRIVSIRNWRPNGAAESTISYETPELEEISFTYDTIEWKALPSGKVATDSISSR